MTGKKDLAVRNSWFETDSWFDSLFKNFFEDSFFYPTCAHEKISYPLDSYEDKEGMHIEIAAIEIPREDIKITLENGTILKIQYDKTSCEQDCKTARKYFQKSISRKSFNFGYKLSSKFDLDKITVVLADGLLKIDIPYSENINFEPKQIEIK